jgi:PAS domain S-box-containing protein
MSPLFVNKRVVCPVPFLDDLELHGCSVCFHDQKTTRRSIHLPVRPADCSVVGRRIDIDRLYTPVSQRVRMNDPGEDSPNFQLLSREDLESEIRDRTSYLENLMDTMVDVLVELDPEGRISMVNRACEEILGYPEEEVVGKPIDYLFASAEDEQLSSMLSQVEFVQRLLTDRQLTDVEVVFETTDGETIPMSLSASVMEAENGSVDGMVCVAKDISERKEAEQRAEFLHSLLRHDLGNKLQIIHGNLEVATTGDYEDAETLVETALASTDEAMELIDSVRMLERLEHDPDCQPITIGNVVDRVVEQYEELSTEKGMEIETDADSVPPVLAGSLLGELVANLVENAIHHSEGTLVRVRARERAEIVRLAVEDDGTGIPPENRERILEKGMKGEGSTGSGLGTYLARQIAETYGGDLAVEESPLGGARFVVTLSIA